MDGEQVRQLELSHDRRRRDFTAFYGQEVSPLVGYVVKVTGATVYEAADAAQSALALAWERWDAIEHPRAWVRTVATREFYRSLPERRTVAGHALLNDDDVVEAEDRWEAVVAAMARLPMMQRQVLAMTADGFTDEEIGRELRTSVPRGAAEPQQGPQGVEGSAREEGRSRCVTKSWTLCSRPLTAVSSGRSTAGCEPLPD